MLVFLALNGIELDYSQQELSDTFFALASGTLDEAGLLEWIGNHQKG
jgi:death-on-curing protein